MKTTYSPVETTDPSCKVTLDGSPLKFQLNDTFFRIEYLGKDTLKSGIVKIKIKVINCNGKEYVFDYKDIANEFPKKRPLSNPEKLLILAYIMEEAIKSLDEEELFCKKHHKAKSTKGCKPYYKRSAKLFSKIKELGLADESNIYRIIGSLRKFT